METLKVEKLGNFCRVVATRLRQGYGWARMWCAPEYVTLEGLIHRDSPKYVTKKICLTG